MEYKNSSFKFPKGKEGEIACMKCRLKRKPFKDEVVITQKTKALIKLQALCECCGTEMHTTKNSVCGYEMRKIWSKNRKEELKTIFLFPQVITRHDSSNPTNKTHFEIIQKEVVSELYKTL